MNLRTLFLTLVLALSLSLPACLSVCLCLSPGTNFSCTWISELLVLQYLDPGFAPAASGCRGSTDYYTISFLSSGTFRPGQTHFSVHPTCRRCSSNSEPYQGWADALTPVSPPIHPVVSSLWRILTPSLIQKYRSSRYLKG